VSGQLYLDGSKLPWYQERLDAWRRGERVAPLTVDLALTRACQMSCQFCFAEIQGNQSFKITKEHMKDLLDDFKEVGVKGVSIVSDGESSLSPAYAFAIQYGHSLGLAMASGTNAHIHNEKLLREILPCLTYFRVNITAADEKRYGEIMMSRKKIPGAFEKVINNIKTAVKIKKELGLSVTIGMQAVLRHDYSDQIIPLAKLGKELGVDYMQHKQMADDAKGSLGMDYSGYNEDFFKLLREAETYSEGEYRVIVKWMKIKQGNNRQFQRCHAPRFHLQISGSGLIAPCGPLFGDDYKQFHIANITKERFRDVIKSDKYWAVMDHLASDKFNAQKDCSFNCIQDAHAHILDREVRLGEKIENHFTERPMHAEFI
jgi:MoaA/NifB/PqqE/SkfB family radical SAM enzyme